MSAEGWALIISAIGIPQILQIILAYHTARKVKKVAKETSVQSEVLTVLVHNVQDVKSEVKEAKETITEVQKATNGMTAKLEKHAFDEGVRSEKEHPEGKS